MEHTGTFPEMPKYVWRVQNWNYYLTGLQSASLLENKTAGGNAKYICKTAFPNVDWTCIKAEEMHLLLVRPRTDFQGGLEVDGL